MYSKTKKRKLRKTLTSLEFNRLYYATNKRSLNKNFILQEKKDS